MWGSWSFIKVFQLIMSVIKLRSMSLIMDIIALAMYEASQFTEYISLMIPPRQQALCDR